MGRSRSALASALPLAPPLRPSPLPSASASLLRPPPTYLHAGSGAVLHAARRRRCRLCQAHRRPRSAASLSLCSGGENECVRRPREEQPLRKAGCPRARRRSSTSPRPGNATSAEAPGPSCSTACCHPSSSDTTSLASQGAEISWRICAQRLGGYGRWGQ